MLMRKIKVKEITILAAPAFGLLIFGAYLSQAGRRPSAPRLVVKNTSVVPTGFTPKVSYAVQPDKRLKVLVQYNPQTWLNNWQAPKFTTSPSFDLVDETGRKYIVNLQSVAYFKNTGKNQYEVAYDFPLYQVVRQMPLASKQVILKTKVIFPDGWALPISAIVHQRR